MKEGPGAARTRGAGGLSGRRLLCPDCMSLPPSSLPPRPSSSAASHPQGSVSCAGSVVTWLRDGVGFVGSSAEVEGLAASVPDTAGVAFVPAFNGLLAPHWRSDARGLVIGGGAGGGQGDTRCDASQPPVRGASSGRGLLVLHSSLSLVPLLCQASLAGRRARTSPARPSSPSRSR